MPKREETGIEELRHAARVSEWNSDAFDGYTAEECLNAIRACWRSGWDILPDALLASERAHAAVHGKLSEECLARLEKELG
jgi:hypothetical protein